MNDHSCSTTSATMATGTVKRWRILTPLALIGLTVIGTCVGCQALDRGSGIVRAPDIDTGPLRSPSPKQDRPPDAPEQLNLIQQAQLLREQGLREQALEAFERAIQENPTAPKSVPAYLGSGDLHLSRGDAVTAQKRYETAAEIDPSNFEAHFKNGLMLQTLKRVGEAIGAYLRALEIDQYDFKANLNVATAYLQVGDARTAVRFAERAVEINPNDASAHANLGAIYAELKRHGDAVAQYRRAAELDELSPPLLLNLANSLGRMEPPHLEEMLNTLDYLLKVSPNALAHERRGFALFKLKRYDESLSSFRAALSLDPNHYPAWNGVGVIMINRWIESDKEDEVSRQEALKAWRKSLSIERNQPRIVELIGTYQ